VADSRNGQIAERSLRIRLEKRALKEDRNKKNLPGGDVSEMKKKGPRLNTTVSREGRRSGRRSMRD